jgi:ribosome-associated heat shock protein Hsp15
MPEPPPRVRLDKWLWAARFYKTRALAAEAVDGGKVRVNDERAKRARPLAAGDAIVLRAGPFEYQITVRAVSERRGNAQAAMALYEETAASKAQRERVALQLKVGNTLLTRRAERPTKRDRRRLERFKRGE